MPLFSLAVGMANDLEFLHEIVVEDEDNSAGGE
ncbi:hypothetical protein A2U01_0116108, partial [Trifolium medium]|nr:hypothetical protein [Trifolium medium]